VDGVLNRRGVLHVGESVECRQAVVVALPHATNGMPHAGLNADLLVAAALAVAWLATQRAVEVVHDIITIKGLKGRSFVILAKFVHGNHLGVPEPQVFAEVANAAAGLLLNHGVRFAVSPWHAPGEEVELRVGVAPEELLEATLASLLDDEIRAFEAAS